MPACLPPPPFHPTEEAADDILAAYVDPDQTLAEIARRFKVSIRALAAWLNHPDTIHHIDELQQVTSRRTRLIAVANERLALNLLISVIEGHLDTEANTPVNTQSLKAVAQRDRARATARLAASQLSRLARSPHGPVGTGVPPVHSAPGPHNSETYPQRTPTPRESHTPQSQAGRLCHTDPQTINPPDPSPAHPITSSPPPASSPLRAPPCDPVFHRAPAMLEAG